MFDKELRPLAEQTAVSTFGLLCLESYKGIMIEKEHMDFIENYYKRIRSLMKDKSAISDLDDQFNQHKSRMKLLTEQHSPNEVKHE